MELDSFPADPAPVRNRVRNRRLAIGAAVLVVALATPIGIAVARHDPATVTAASAKSVGLDELHSRDALVTVPRQGDAAAVQRTLDGTAAVTSYTVLAPGTPSALRANRQTNLTPKCDDAGGFVVQLRHGAADVANLEAALAHDAVVEPWRSVAGESGFAEGILLQSQHPTESEIFMQVDATPEQVALVRQRVAHDTDIARFTYLDKQAALAEFRRIFKDQPALIAATTADALSESFRITPKDGVDADLLVQHYSYLPGVDEVLSPHSVRCP
jgi:hypothetical protein